MIIKLNIFHHTDDTTSLDRLDIDYDIEQCEIREVIFFNINALSDYYSNDKVYTYIHCNGSVFISPIPKFEIMKMIYP